MHYGAKRMDETDADPDCSLRALCLEAALWYFDRTGDEVQDPSAVTNVAKLFMHYLTNGQVNEFDPKTAPTKCVRGQ